MAVASPSSVIPAPPSSATLPTVLFAALPVACYTIDAAGRITFFNAAAERLWGRTPEAGHDQWCGSVALADLEGAPIPRERSAAAIALAEKRPVHGVELLVIRADGSRRWVIPHADPLFDPEGRCIGAINVLVDVTEQRSTAQALRLSEERLREGIDAANMGSWRVDLATGLRTRDAGLNRILGYPAAETTLPLDDGPHLVHPDDRRAMIAAWETAIATHGIYEAEFRIRRLDGSERWLREQGRAVPGDSGQPGFVTGVTLDITERRRTSLAAQHLAAIVESSDDAIMSKNLDGIITSWNRGAQRVFGYTAEETVGQPVQMLIPPERIDEEPGILARVRAGERIEHYETVRRRKDGTLINVSLTVSPIRDAQDRIIGASKIARDITFLKRSDETLRQRTRTLEILNRVGSTLVAERDLEKVVQAVTDAGREISEAAFGAFFYNLKDAAGESYTLYTLSGVPREAFSKFPMPRNTAVFAPTFGGEGVVRVGDIRKDPRYGQSAPHHGMPKGHLPVCSYLAVPVMSRTGQVLGGLFFGHPEPDRFTQHVEDVMVALASQAAIAIDNAQLYIALQRELDQQRLTENALRESAAQLRLITDNAPVLLAQLDRDLRYKFVNRPYATRYKKEPHDFIGHDVRDVLGHAPYEAARPQIERAFAGEVVEFEAEIDYQIPHLGKRWCHVTYTPERAPTGEVIGMLAVVTDITMRKQSEVELEQARDRAVAASRAKDEFLAALSHELRTPLNPVLLLASDAASNPALPDDVRADFDSIRKNVDLEARLIDDLLDITRITRGKLPLEMRALNLHTALQDALTIVRPEIEAKRLLLDLDFSATTTSVWGDEVRLQQVFWNVLKNAVKFTPDSGRITVQTSNDAARGVLLVKIIDTGIGMTPEEQAHVFESFTQGDHATKTGSHRFGGLGLGLAISRMLVEMHTGRILAHSGGRDRGSEFTIELPLHQGASRQAGTGPAWPLTSAPRLSAQPAAKPATPVRRTRVLLVEDHAPTRNTLAQLLTRRHFDVLPAASVAEARAIAAHGDFQFVISDIGLPDGDGYGLMGELRAARPGLSGIALSGYGMEEDVARSRQAGFAQHLIKPVNITTLEEAIACITGAASDAVSKKT